MTVPDGCDEVTETTQFNIPVQRAGADLLPRAGVLLLAAVGFAVAGWLLGPQPLSEPGQPMPPLQAVMLLVAGTLAMCAGWCHVIARADQARRDTASGAMIRVLDRDAAPSLVADADGRLIYCNKAAMTQLQAESAATLGEALKACLADPGLLLYRLGSRAQSTGAAQEDVPTKSGRLRISVHRTGDGFFLWRIEASADRPQEQSDATPLPMLTVGRNDTVLFMNAAARRLVGERIRTLDQLCPKRPLRSGTMTQITTRDGVQSCLLVELDGGAGRREIFLLPGLAAPEYQADGWAFFDELPVPLLKVAATGEVQLSNRPARDLLGVDQCRDMRLSDLMDGLGRPITDWLGDAAAGRGTVHAEFMRVRRDDREVFVQVSLNRVAEAGQTVLIAVLSDATKLKSLEAQFVQSQKMQAIGQLAGGVAHDFNNLLTAISGHCDLLLLRHDQGDGDYADLVQISQNANRAAALVSQLLAYSRKQTLRPEIMDLRDMLADLTHLLNRLVGEKVSLTLCHDPVLARIRADKRQLEQVLMNLVVNARDAMPKGGDIRIVTENLQLDEALRRGRAVVAPGRYVSVKVIDEGIGIAADKLQKVFEPFYSSKRMGEGTGLGLSTAYGIVKQTGGFIFVDSAPGEGATFQLLLPAYTDAVPPQPTPDAPPRSTRARSDGVVLLVEDEAPVRAFASRALQMRGFTVLEADSAEQALELLAQDDLVVDVFVSDVVMPGMDGPTWVRQALRDRPGVHVVFMSGYAEETFSDSQAEIPNSVFLPKPFSLTDLTDLVQRQLA